MTQISKALLLTRSAATPPCKLRGGASIDGFHLWRAVALTAALSVRVQRIGIALGMYGAAQRTVAVSRVTSKCGRLSSS